MLKTTFLNMKKPEGADPVNVQDFNENFDTLDTEVNARVKASAGDISNTKIVTADSITTEFPVPAANDTAKGFLGKMKKFCTDFNNFKSGVITLGKLVNNGQCTEAGFALDARYGKVLYDLFAQLNRDFVLQDLNNVKFMDRPKSMELMYYPTASTYYRLSISKTESNLDLIYNNGSTESRVWSSKDDLKSYFPDYYGSQITNDVMNLNNKLNGVWYGGVAGSTNNLPAGVKNALVRLLKYSSSAVFLEVIDMDTGVRHSNLWQASAGWFGWK